MKNAIALLLILALIFGATACAGDISEPASAAAVSELAVTYDNDDLDDSASAAGMSSITLEGDTISLDGRGAIVDGSTVTITAAGVYAVSGVLDDGQIRVNTDDTGVVRLILDGADIACSRSAPIYVVAADKVVITLAEGTENYVTDGDTYVFEDEESDEPNAAIFSKSDLTINGGGSLTVTASYNNGIQSKDELKITGGTITVSAANDAVKGRDCIAVRDGTITLTAGGDGMQSTNDEDSEKGFVVIQGGVIDITAGEDGIQAETSLEISGGNLTITSGGGSTSAVATGPGGNMPGDWGDQGMGGMGDRWGREDTDDTGDAFGDFTFPDNAGQDMLAIDDMSDDATFLDDAGQANQWFDDTADTAASAKGLKAGVKVAISGGTIDIDSSDDAVHSNDSIEISGGTLTLASGDDGIHADNSIEISGGEIDITTCYEGIESGVITIDDGTIRIVASDDGINAPGGDAGMMMGGQPEQNDSDVSGEKNLYINGGYIFIEAGGDGLDVSNSIYMTAGTVIINGPTTSADGAIDYMGTFNISGGLLLAVGSSGMAQGPGTASTQYTVMLNLSSAQAGGTALHIEAEDGEDILTFTPTKTYQSVVFSSPQLENGATYLVYCGGTQVTSFTISGMVTGEGSGGGFGGGQGGGMGGGGGMFPGGGGGRR